jgi:hypothetical protein
MANHALVIGTSTYDPEAQASNLPFVKRDAIELARLLRHRYMGLFPEFNVTLIVDGSHWLIQQKLEDTLTNTKPDDLILVYFSGHGIRDEYGELHLLASNSKRKRTHTTTISIDTIKALMLRSNSRKQILILDACYSGAVGDDLLTKGNSNENTPFDEMRGEGNSYWPQLLACR